MPQKVISINVSSGDVKSNNSFFEYEFPLLNKYLEEGYTVKQFHQITPSESVHSCTLTFVLEKTNY